MAELTPADALERLRAGNARFVAGTPRSEPFGARMAQLANGQSPFGVVLGCSDSRVPVETIFDQEPGKLFVVRVAGNFLNADGLGSIEFAVEALKAKLVLVLGHERCGAVGAALNYVRDGVEQPGHIQELVNAIVPAVQATRGGEGDWHASAVAANVELTVTAMLARSHIIGGAVERGDLAVVGGIYSIRTGNVAFS
ncbi:MAG: carbonic anhydrase [Candidatus Eremiobacteraeota bacterium]|nr:carbonic anhydrase [Candidatus Eremiobacteraeota bacterium]MBV8499684.1 carbonic anhydrase [Candidatus Eremiobacteraeota bacterium]